MSCHTAAIKIPLKLQVFITVLKSSTKKKNMYCFSVHFSRRKKKIVYFSPVIPGVCFSDAVTKARFSPEFHVFLSS